MRRHLLQEMKWSFTIVGKWLPKRWLYALQMALNYLKLGNWMAEHNFHAAHRAANRQEVFASVAEIVRDQRVLYLEFGVHKGASMRCWSSLLKHPEALLHGFDSFEGLPEDWDEFHPSGTFSTQGRMPAFDDTRVQLFKGWFDEVLPHYTVPEHDILVIIMDADLYSSTIYVLRQLREWIRPGTFIYLDDLSHFNQELKAFDEFLNESSLRFRLVAADRSLKHAFFRCDS